MSQPTTVAYHAVGVRNGAAVARLSIDDGPPREYAIEVGQLARAVLEAVAELARAGHEPFILIHYLCRGLRKTGVLNA